MDHYVFRKSVLWWPYDDAVASTAQDRPQWSSPGNCPDRGFVYKAQVCRSPSRIEEDRSVQPSANRFDDSRYVIIWAEYGQRGAVRSHRGPHVRVPNEFASLGRREGLGQSDPSGPLGNVQELECRAAHDREGHGLIMT